MAENSRYSELKNNDKTSDFDDDSDGSDIEDWNLPLCFDKSCHYEPIRAPERIEHTWRVKEKYKTHCVALVMCLNLGVDPPDVVKTQPCARHECWIDPLSLSPVKALESIGHSLQAQYERWQPRARYKQSLDPTSEEVKKLCCSLRRNAKDERVLFHYNGHGVPKPTSQGEIWVFNRTYTQYIPLSMYDLQSWMGAPSLYVYDCSNAGVILDNFRVFADQHEREMQNNPKGAPGVGVVGGEEGVEASPVSFKNCIQLGACAAGQSLPMNPELPADLFTACLTTPVKMAMKWFVLRNRNKLASTKDLHDLIDNIPGQVTDRRTMLGELNWIFTAITDTIAWTSLPVELFQQLFRADLLTASLCRNYLLADRVMRSYNCTPVCSPHMPSLARHPLWAAWEQALDLALAQLPRLLADPGASPAYRHSPFFAHQLTAFQLWLDLGSAERPPPDQLPMVLQVLLSTLHRVRALRILCRFLALGEWAVRATLAVGIFPYMLKLLQASAPDLRPPMLYIWANIIAVDPSCQVELVNAKGHKYFLNVLQDPTVDADNRMLAAYVLAGIVDNYPPGQEAALQASMIPICLEQLTGVEWGAEGEVGGAGGVRVWAAAALSSLWRGHAGARAAAARDLAHAKLLHVLTSTTRPLLRAAAANALAALMRGASARTENVNALECGVALAQAAAADAAPLVRAEVLAGLQWLVLIFEQHFIAVCVQERTKRSDREWSRGGRVDPCQDALAAGPRAQHSLSRSNSATPAATLPTIGFNSVYTKLWQSLCEMATEPHPQVAKMAQDIIDYISNQLDSVGRDAVGGGSCSSACSSTSTSPSSSSFFGHRRAKSGLASTLSEDCITSRDRDRESTSSSSGPALKKAIVETQFLGWARGLLGRGRSEGRGADADPESARHHQRCWRYHTNTSIRKQAKELVGAKVSRLESAAFHSRFALPPTAMQFHPYRQHLALAFRDSFGVWDWGTGARLCGSAVPGSLGRLTSLAFLCAHDSPLLALASHKGHLQLFRLGEGCSLVAAWRALPSARAPPYRPPHAQPLYADASGEGGATVSGGGVGVGTTTPEGRSPSTLLSWSARRASLLVGGSANSLVLWDALSERSSGSLWAGEGAAVSALWRHGFLAGAGLHSGELRMWDERASPMPTFQLKDHRAPLLCVAVSPHGTDLITVCLDGVVRGYDMRVVRREGLGMGMGAGEEGVREGVGVRARAQAPLAAAAVHPRADLMACGSVNQCINVFDLRGAPLNTIKFHEGFMAARIGPVSCLAFHPLRLAMGVGSKDSTVSVYVSEPRPRR